jgi:signal transduction histidine kinase
VSPAEDVHLRSGPGAELGSESAAVDVALDGWRRKATDILLAVVAVAHLPVIVLAVLGHGPLMGLFPKTVGLAVYVVAAVAALLRWVDYRRRVWASVMALYPALLIATLVAPHGPYAQIGVVTMPIYALVLLGSPAARIAIVASTAIIVSAPLLREQLGVIHLLGINLAQEAAPPGLVWFRATVKAASLFALMILLDRFHRLLLDALAQRIAAQRKMKDEMNGRQRLEREIASVGDEERRHLGQELHDGVCQQVTAALLRCQALERRLERGGVLSGTDFAPLSSLLGETIDDAHNVARGLCPLEPDPDALAPALRALTKRTQEMAGVRCEFRASGDVRVHDPEAAQHLYRIGQEALSNAVQHAKANRIAIELCANDGELTLQIQDDGAGVPAHVRGGGMGLRTMAYRAQIMKGEFAVEPAPGGGTRVTCRVPHPAGALAAGHHA